MKIIGDLETSGVVKIDGAVEGSIRGARQVLLGRSGTIQGDVHAEEAVLAGKVIGTVVATERVEVQSTSRIDGDIHTKSIIVLEGGTINGNVRMDDGAGRASTSIPAIAQAPRGPLSLSQ
jgi:cytoskeletal protein CcmA (bactofilin family)